MVTKDHWFEGAFLDWEDFESNYWRKKPVSVSRVSVQAAVNDGLAANDLFRLCRNDLVESRLISNIDGEFKLAFGPFDLDTLPLHSMLMVQGLESHLAGVSEYLVDSFAFLPRWRIEDVMVSYGHENTSCGAHFDHYDVFLVQVRGSKCWHLDEGNHVDEDLSPASDIRLLQDFHASEKIYQQPGDILYIPPRTGHWGITSCDDCLTLSVGIRNPTLGEMISHLADLAGDELTSNQTLDDSLTEANGIDQLTTRSITKKMANVLLNPSLTDRWFGAFMTELKEPDLISNAPEQSDADIIRQLQTHRLVQCHLATRLAYQVSGDKLNLYVNGESLTVSICSQAWIVILEAQRQVESSVILESVRESEQQESNQDKRENLRVLSFLLQLGAVCMSSGERE
ncbi:MAG: cupin domain-containing protein [bacterium]|nr:cupin domain-containing protein [Gammaproteobacteria bacterium]HIL96830.1 cupin domain-containing protein [Pseudomonadales bacterium]